MKFKRLSAFVIAVIMLFSLNACKGNEDTSAITETTLLNIVVYETVTESVLNTETGVVETVVDASAQESVQPITTETTSVIDEAVTTDSFDDPANWSTKRIVTEYKNAAKKSHSTVKSSQNIALKKISVNDGEYDKAFSFITPIIAKFLESNSTEKDGITGGFENLTTKDVSTAKAYKNGNDTVIEMVMLDQTSGPREDALSGSVGHAITAVGDISTVVKDLSDRGLPLELCEEETFIYYTNPVIKVTINENGEIINGTWSYTVEISMNNFKAFGQTVEKGSVIMENTITV